MTKKNGAPPTTPRLSDRDVQQRAHRWIVLWIAPKIYQMQRRFNTLSADEKKIYRALSKLQEYHERRDGQTIFR